MLTQNGTESNKFLLPELAREFILGGNAIFTIRSKVTNTRFTYKVAKSDHPGMYFVSLLLGSDNTNDYQYFGFFFIAANESDGWTYRHGKPGKACRNLSSDAVIAFKFMMDRLMNLNYIHEGIEIWHEGHCGRCGRTLTVPESIERGFGPECIRNIGG